MSLQKTIESLAATFVDQVLSALRSASLQDISLAAEQSRSGKTAPQTSGKPGSASAALIAPRGRRAPGRLRRRSLEDIEKTVTDIVSLLRSRPKGMRAEELRKELRLDPRELPRPIQEGLDSRRLLKKGEKRATTYFLGTGGSASKQSSRGRKK